MSHVNEQPETRRFIFHWHFVGPVSRPEEEEEALFQLGITSIMKSRSLLIRFSCNEATKVKEVNYCQRK